MKEEFPIKGCRFHFSVLTASLRIKTLPPLMKSSTVCYVIANIIELEEGQRVDCVHFHPSI